MLMRFFSFFCVYERDGLLHRTMQDRVRSPRPGDNIHRFLPVRIIAMDVFFIYIFKNEVKSCETILSARNRNHAA